MTYLNSLKLSILLLLCGIETITETDTDLVVRTTGKKTYYLPLDSTVVTDFQAEIATEYTTSTSVGERNVPIHINMKHIETVKTTDTDLVVDFVSGQTIYLPLNSTIATDLQAVRAANAKTYTTTKNEPIVYSLCNAAQATTTTGDNHKIEGVSGKTRYLPLAATILADLANVDCCAAGTTPPTPTSAKVNAPIILFDAGKSTVQTVPPSASDPAHILTFNANGGVDVADSYQWDIAADALSSNPLSFVPISDLPVFNGTTGDDSAALELLYNDADLEKSYCLRLTVTDGDGNTSEGRVYLYAFRNLLRIVIQQGSFEIDAAGVLALASDASYSIEYDNGTPTTPLFNTDTYHLDIEQDGTADVSDTVIANITNTYAIGTSNSNFGTEDSTNGGGYQEKFAQRLVVVVA